MQTRPRRSTPNPPEFNCINFGLCWLLSGLLVAQAYFVFGAAFTDGFIWNYFRVYDGSASDGFCMMMIENAVMITFPLVIIGMLIALPFALKLERQVSSNTL